MIRTLIVDDEAPARRKIRGLLAREEDFQPVGEAAAGDEAVERIRTLAPDVVFLDIQMPRGDGFQVVEAIGPAAMPVVVFVTAYDEHALRAFEVEALGYLLKPFSQARFQRVLHRLREQLRSRDDDLASRLERLLRERGEPAFARQLLVENEPGRERLVAVATMDLIRAQGNRLQIFTNTGGEFYRRGPLTALAERLDPKEFLRINRSEIVRLDAVRELQPWFHGDYRLLLHNGQVLSWSRRYRARDKGRF